MKGIILILSILSISFLLFACEREPQCTDSDGGINYGLRGTVVSDGEELTDFCVDEWELREYYCEDGVGLAWRHNCSMGCELGECINVTGDNCTDSDGGINYFEQGAVSFEIGDYVDSCYGGVLTEYHCVENTSLGYEHYECMDDCVGGACTFQGCEEKANINRGESYTFRFRGMTYEVTLLDIVWVEAYLSVNSVDIDPMMEDDIYFITDLTTLRVTDIISEERISACFMTV